MDDAGDEDEDVCEQLDATESRRLDPDDPHFTEELLRLVFDFFLID